MTIIAGQAVAFILLPVLSCIICGRLNAQSKDSLLKQLTIAQGQKNYGSQNITVDLLNKLSVKCLFDAPDSSIYFANTALQLSKTQEYLLGQARALSNMAKAYYIKSSYDSSLSFSENALSLSQSLNDSMGIANDLNNIGLIYLGHEQIPAAIKQFNKSLVLAKALHDSVQVTITYFNLGVCYDELKKVDSAAIYLNNTIQGDRYSTDHHLTIMAYNRMGKTLFLANKFNEAIEWYTKVLNNTIYRDTWELTFANNGMAETYINLKDYTKAINYGLQAYALAKTMKAKWDIEQALKTLAAGYGATGDFKNAYQYQALDAVYKDSIASEAKDEVVNYMKLQQKETVNEGLRQQNALIKQKINLTHIYNICISIVALALIVSLILLYRNYKAKEVLNKQLVDKNNKIEHLNKMKDQLFAVVSHDLRGPMGSLQQTLQLIIDEALAPEQQKYLLENLFRQVTVSNQMLNNLLTWAATQRKGIAARIDKIQPGTVIKEVLGVFETLADKKGVSVLYDDSNEQPLLADGNQLRIIVQNLLSNAIKFTPPKGVVSIFYTFTDVTVFVHIHDTGSGISKERQDKLFKNFGSVISTIGTANEKGAGIGLMIVKEFTEQNNGTLSIKSGEGAGTTFSVGFGRG